MSSIYNAFKPTVHQIFYSDYHLMRGQQGLILSDLIKLSFEDSSHHKVVKKTFRILLLLLLCMMGLNACRAEQRPNEKTLLWRVSGRGLKQPSYLFGTIHLICPSDYLWTDAMKKALTACTTVCFEMDMDDPSLLQQASEGLIDTSGKTLQEYFTPHQYSRLEQFAHDSLGTDLALMQQMRPMMLESLLMSRSIGCILPVSYEANIMLEAQKNKQKIIGLESLQEQLDVVNSLPDDSVASGLMQLVDSFSESRNQYNRMLQAYKQQDLPALYDQIKASKELGTALGVFLDNRNLKWIPRMVKQMQSGPVFYAVGAGHLWGGSGVIHLLRTAGYIVTPVH